jgi:hypothetical protein
MKDDRKRVPLADDYALALGVAAYCFARCEWDVVWCCERIQPGALQKIVGDKLTAGGIAKRFKNLVRSMPASAGRKELEALASEFEKLVETRNAIAHGKPCTAPGGAQRLSSPAILEIADLERAADDFTTCSLGLNSMLYGFLKAP